MADDDQALLDYYGSGKDHFSGVGQKSLDKIASIATTLEKVTKLIETNLAFGKGSILTQETQNLWAKRFDCYREKSTSDKYTDTPSGETVRGFVVAMHLVVETSLPGKHAPNENVMLNAMRNAISYCTFRFKDFRWTGHDSLRLATALDDLVKRGKLTRGAWKPKQWVGSMIVRRLCYTYFRHALVNGVNNFDLTVAHVLAILSMAIMGNRAGDVAALTGKFGNKGWFFAWKDIEMHITNHSPNATFDEIFASIKVKITLRHTKGHKEVQNDDFAFKLAPLNSSESNTGCFVSIVLIHALRHGLVQGGNTIEQVLNSARQRPDGRVIFTKPEAPVLPGLANKFRILDFGQPMTTQYIRNALKRISLIAGMIEPLRTHSIRHGHAKETAQLSKIKGTATYAVAQAMGHSHTAMAKGITAKYTGGVESELWNDKVENAGNTSFATYAPYAVDNVYVPARLKNGRIAEFCRQNDLDVKKATDHEKARKILHQEDEDAWRAKNLDLAAPVKRLKPTLPATDMPSLMPPPPAPVPTPSLPLSTVSSSAVNSMTRSTRSRAGIDKQKDNGVVKGNTNEHGKSRNTRNETLKRKSSATMIDPELLADDSDNTLGPMDPALLKSPSLSVTNSDDADDFEVNEGELDSIQTLITGTSQAEPALALEDEITEADEYMVLKAIAPQADTAVDTMLTSSPQMLIDALAKHNVYRSTKFALQWARDKTQLEDVAMHGNSRDDPTPYMLTCPTPHCTFQTVKEGHLAQHLAICTPALVAKNAKNSVFTCCKITFATKADFQAHELDVHQFTPRPCPQHCNNDEVFDNIDTFNSHQDHYHAVGFESKPCPAPQVMGKTNRPRCDKAKLYGSNGALRAHLKSIHNSSTEELDQFCPKAKKGPKQGSNRFHKRVPHKSTVEGQGGFVLSDKPTFKGQGDFVLSDFEYQEPVATTATTPTDSTAGQARDDGGPQQQLVFMPYDPNMDEDLDLLDVPDSDY